MKNRGLFIIKTHHIKKTAFISLKDDKDKFLLFTFLFLCSFVFMLIACEDTKIINSNDKDITKNQFEIYTWQDLQNIHSNLAGNYVLMKDIVFPALGENGFSTGGFDPIAKDTATGEGNSGHQGDAFSGTFDGNGKTITGLHINRADLDYVGLFGKIEAMSKDTVVVKDLTLVDVTITANAMAGILVAYLKQGTINNVVIDGVNKVESDSKVRESDIDGSEFAYTGGLVGAVGNKGIITNVFNKVSVTGVDSVMGGVVGYNEGVVSAVFTGNMRGITDQSNNVGGLVGVNTGTLTGYAAGAVEANKFVGGLVGYNDSSGVVGGYATNTVQARDLVSGGLAGVNSGTVIGYATGAVTDNGAGGLVGRFEDGFVYGYWDKKSTGQSSSAAGSGISDITHVKWEAANSKYYDDVNGDDTRAVDNTEPYVFDKLEFLNLFTVSDNMPGTWPKLKKTYTLNSVSFTLSDTLLNR